MSILIDEYRCNVYVIVRACRNQCQKDCSSLRLEAENIISGTKICYTNIDNVYQQILSNVGLTSL